jgi:hypothetical protein
MKMILSLLFLSMVVSSCGDNYGKSVSDKGHKLYYTEPVTEAEAKDVLNWLHETNHNWGQPPAPFQLNKQGNKYIFRYAVQNEENLESSTGFMETFATKLSERLKGAPVDIYLMDAKLEKQLKVISSDK